MNSFLKNNFISISFGTSLSKLIGLIRQIFIAAAFGVGLTYDAFNYAYIIPGFFIIIISGINGPLHNAIVAIVTPLKANKAGLVLSRVSIKLTLVFSLIAVIIYAKATYLIGIIGPDLNLETKLSAIRQLKIIAPCIPLSAFIGLSFGALNSRNKFLISSLSPSIVSFSIILFIILNWVFNLENKFESGFLGTNLLALATLIGTFLQFVIQLIETYRIDILRFNRELFKFGKEEKRIFKLIIPTTLSSGVGQINVFVDMFFVSSFPGAASSLAYGNFLIQAPLGILSNALILPILPKFSNLINKYPIKSIEDPFAEDEWQSWNKLTKSTNIQIVGDDLFATNLKRLIKCIDEHYANAILVKLNQIGTVSETLQVIDLAQKNNFKTIISHRSGDSEDTFIADLCVATKSSQIKSGSLARSERVSKYNRLLRIEDGLGKLAKMAKI